MQDANSETNNETNNETAETAASKAMFDPTQIRVLGCLMEKQLTTPDNYPLTQNSIVLACNQKTNRHPKMNVTKGEVGNAINRLNDDEHIRTKFGSRSDKYSHAMRGNFSLDVKQQAILCVLMLREPLTISDIAARTARMAEFENNAEIKNILSAFSTRATPLVQSLPAGSGRREDRYTHCFSGKIDSDVVDSVAPSDAISISANPSRLDELEERVAKLEKVLGELME